MASRFIRGGYFARRCVRAFHPAAPEELAERLVAGDRVALSKAITLAENTRTDSRDKALILLQRALLLSKEKHGERETFRIGISGAPGVGKSSFIESMGCYVTDNIHRSVAVLAVDPSSPVSGGSILGDRTRMEQLPMRKSAFVRPSPTRGRLGGVAQHTDEVIQLCECAGYDVVFVETVGVGQSEVEVSSVCDMLLLLLQPGAGDALQGIKKGIMEIADLVVINKADGPLAELAARCRHEYQSALHLLSPRTSLWSPKALTCSSHTGKHMDRVWGAMSTYWRVMSEAGEIERRRGRQRVEWLWKQVQGDLVDKLRTTSGMPSRIAEVEQRLREGTITPRYASLQLVEAFCEIPR